MTQLTETFNQNQIRITKIDNEKRMAASDVCQALGYKNPSTNWTNLKSRNPELLEETVPIKMVGTDGKQYDTDTLNIEGVIVLCMLAKTELASNFRRWAKGVLAEKMTQQVIQQNPTEMELNARNTKAIEEQSESLARMFDLGDVAKKAYAKNQLIKANIEVPAIDSLKINDPDDELFAKKEEIYKHFGAKGKGSQPLRDKIASIIEEVLDNEDYCIKEVRMVGNGKQVKNYAYRKRILKYIDAQIVVYKANEWLERG